MTDRVSKLKQEIFQKLVKLGIIDDNGKILYQYMKFQVPEGGGAFMDLNIDWLWYDKLSIAHNNILNGDVMADPDQQVKIDADKKEAFAYTFQNDYAGYYHTAQTGDDVYDERGVIEHSVFLTGWLDNIQQWGYEVVKTMPLDVREEDREEIERQIEEGKKMMQDLSDGKITMEDLLKRLEGKDDEKDENAS